MTINNMLGHNHNLNLMGSHTYHYNESVGFGKLICDIGKFQYDNVSNDEKMTYIIGYPSGEVIDIKINQINDLKQEGVIFFERKWGKYAFVDEHRDKVIDRLRKISKNKSFEENFLTMRCELDYKDFNINKDFSVDIYTNIDLRNLNINRIPITFGIVEGNFDCSDNKLSNLVNSPFLVEGKFICRDNELYSLIRGPIVLEGYYCQNNFLQDLEGMVLGNTAKEVRVSSNQIVKLKEKDFQNLKNIENLSVDENLLSDLDGISKLRYLKILNCQRNKIKTFEDICNISELEQLYIFENRLIQLEGLEKMKRLQVLSCGGNHLKNLDGIEDLPNLRGIYCQHNEFSERYKTFLKDYCLRNKIKLLV